MPIVITLDIPADVETTLEKACFALASAGYHGLYHSLNQTPATIFIDNSGVTLPSNPISDFQDILSQYHVAADVIAAEAAFFSRNAMIGYYTDIHQAIFLDDEFESIESEIINDLRNHILISKSRMEAINKHSLEEYERKHQPKKNTNSYGLDEDDISLFSSHRHSNAMQTNRFQPATRLGGFAYNHFSTFASPSHSSFDDFERTRKQEQHRVQEQNAALMFRSDLEHRTREAAQLSNLKFEKNLFGLLRLLNDVVANQWNEAAISANWLNYFTDKEYISAIINEVETLEKEPQIQLHVAIKPNTFKWYDERSLEEYYASVDSFYDLFLHIIKAPAATERHYDPSRQSSSDLLLRNAKINPNNYASFIFDAQLALLATGLMNTFYISVTYKQRRDDLKNHMLIEICSKHHLIPDSKKIVMTVDLLERLTRLSAANNFIEDLQNLHKYYPQLDLNNQDKNPKKQKTPMHLAVERGHVGMAKLLLNLGVRVDVKDADGNTASSLAEKSGSEEIKHLLVAAQIQDVEQAYAGLRRKM